MSFDNPHDPFAFDNEDTVNDNELHMWSNITDQEFISIMIVRPTTPTTIISNMSTMTIPNVTTINILSAPIELEPKVHRDVIAEANIDEVIDETTKWIWMKFTYPLLIFIHRPMMSPLLCLATNRGYTAHSYFTQRGHIQHCCMPKSIA